jgi:hypothetical protein
MKVITINVPVNRMARRLQGLFPIDRTQNREADHLLPRNTELKCVDLYSQSQDTSS